MAPPNPPRSIFAGRTQPQLFACLLPSLSGIAWARNRSQDSKNCVHGEKRGGVYPRGLKLMPERTAPYQTGAGIPRRNGRARPVFQHGAGRPGRICRHPWWTGTQPRRRKSGGGKTVRGGWLKKSTNRKRARRMDNVADIDASPCGSAMEAFSFALRRRECFVVEGKKQFGSWTQAGDRPKKRRI